MTFLRKYTVRCKIIVEKECLEKVKDFKCLGCEISYENEETYSKKSIRICSNTGNSKQHNETSFCPETFKNTSFYMKEKFGPVEKRTKKLVTSIKTKVWRRTVGTLFLDHKRAEGISEDSEIEPVEEKLIRYNQ